MSWREVAEVKPRPGEVLVSDQVHGAVGLTFGPEGEVVVRRLLDGCEIDRICTNRMRPTLQQRLLVALLEKSMENECWLKTVSESLRVFGDEEGDMVSVQVVEESLRGSGDRMRILGAGNERISLLAAQLESGARLMMMAERHCGRGFED